ncbi:M56 family metallopeptidase [Merismopedia glauca]|uniref:M56 family metallopeptidase n=1 Tax=Merismopedia glauca TaxID=292586 RepID=UPI001C631F58|nr:M56 family metallopeptidase [Merismopedia glauca]
MSKDLGNWSSKWPRSLFSFIFPPLLLLMTALAVLCMGTNGTMLGFEGSKIGYTFALGLWLWALYSLVRLAYQGKMACLELRNYSQATICDRPAHIINTDFPYSAQIGFWQPQLVVSTGLLKTLDSEHIEAVLAHEEVHKNEHHTFWFFWLGWLRTITAWLPHTEALWQELLFWRELRADEQAAQKVDPLLLAEALITVAQTTVKNTTIIETSFSCSFASQRLSERIEALLSPSNQPTKVNSSKWFNWLWILLVFLPWVTVPFHS